MTRTKLLLPLLSILGACTGGAPSGPGPGLDGAATTDMMRDMAPGPVYTLTPGTYVVKDVREVSDACKIDPIGGMLIGSQAALTVDLGLMVVSLKGYGG